MAESPLSITSAVISILTFIAAILAFINVRYTTLRSSYEEMANIFVSGSVHAGETAVIEKLTQGARRRAESRSIENLQSLKDGLIHSKKLLTNLYTLELSIMFQIAVAYGFNFSPSYFSIKRVETLQGINVIGWEKVVKEVKRQKKIYDQVSGTVGMRYLALAILRYVLLVAFHKLWCAGTRCEKTCSERPKKEKYFVRVYDFTNYSR